MSDPTSPEIGSPPPLPVDPAWEVHPQDVSRRLAAGENIVLVDVRNPREWNFCRIQGAVLAPLSQLEQKAQADLQPFKDRPLVVYCHHGVRSLRAAALLRHYGFAHTHSLAGGIDAWSTIIDPALPRY